MMVEVLLPPRDAGGGCLCWPSRASMPEAVIIIATQSPVKAGLSTVNMGTYRGRWRGAHSEPFQSVANNNRLSPASPPLPLRTCAAHQKVAENAELTEATGGGHCHLLVDPKLQRK